MMDKKKLAAIIGWGLTFSFFAYMFLRYVLLFNVQTVAWIVLTIIGIVVAAIVNYYYG